MGQEGVELQWSVRYEACSVYPLKVGTIVALPESLAVTPYQYGPL